MKLVFFINAINYFCRLSSNKNLKKNNVLLIVLDGSSKQSQTKIVVLALKQEKLYYKL